jgi:hypothetical protein
VGGHHGARGWRGHDRGGAIFWLGQGYRLYIGNLSFRTENGRLRDAFEPFGRVVFSTVIENRETGQSRCGVARRSRTLTAVQGELTRVLWLAQGLRLRRV